MMNRFIQAYRLLRGRPLYSTTVAGGTMLLDMPERSEADYATTPPFDLVFAGIVRNAPPEKIFCEGDLRVCLFPTPEDRCSDCCRRCHWLTVELDANDGGWFHLVTMHERNIATMLSVCEDVIAYLRDQH